MDDIIKVLNKYPSGYKLKFEWDNGNKLICEMDTIYETDNDLEDFEEGYVEFYAGIVRIVKFVNWSREKAVFDFCEGGLMEISKFYFPNKIWDDNTLVWDVLN